MRTARRSFRWPVVLLLAAGLSALAGCSGGKVAAPTMTQAQATARAEKILQDTAAVLTPRPRLDFDPSLPNESGVCVADIPNASRMVNVDRTAWLRAITASHNGSIGQQIEAYWKKQGYTITTVGGIKEQSPVITGETKDSFTISLATGEDGLMSLGASSPCIYKNGTPPS